MMSQHSNSLATATAAILVHNENLLRLCTKMAAVSMAKGCMQTLDRVHTAATISQNNQLHCKVPDPLLRV